MSTETETATKNQDRRREIFAFIFLAVLIWPVIAVGVVSGTGFVIWMYQSITGPPGPPDYPV
ncbi:periplasmic nitrate reductase, NapE protein [Caenispirillum salinarum]|uniref:periplasmic nitrate reductase, NapE protein n=1 Tax=Caenispirillum salinarum TaxID=859058 RepID=UPI00384CC9AF